MLPLTRIRGNLGHFVAEVEQVAWIELLVAKLFDDR